MIVSAKVYPTKLVFLEFRQENKYYQIYKLHIKKIKINSEAAEK